uniref:SERTA domain containing 2 n=2 Tax=Sinocyclocheilus rhinocerous TaxID=307959 RepID=A0A673H591_9TELE
MGSHIRNILKYNLKLEIKNLINIMCFASFLCVSLSDIRYMLGKGLKRKLEQEEENGVMKMSCPQEASPACYWLQRQTVLNLSLLKLHSRPGHSEPGLARRVLITNTLRRIQDIPAPQSFPNGVQSHTLAEIEDLCPTVGITTSFTTETGRTLTADPNSDESRQTDPDLSEMNSGMDPASSLSDSAQSVFGHTPSLLADFSLDDFLVTEIDSLLFDNVPCGSSLITSSGASKVVSMVTDDFVKTLAGYGNGGTSQSALPSNQTFKLDLNELDHIMEVLVGSKFSQVTGHY